MSTPTVSIQPLPRIQRDDRLAIFERILTPLKPGRLLDLATGHGKFALVAQRLGWHVTAVDARTERMPGVLGIDWIQADVRSYPVDGYDVIAVLGLLYHLELNDILDLLRRAAGTMTIIDTHLAPDARVVDGGYEGKYFAEKTSELTASVGNTQSFWPHPDAFIRMLLDCGYTDVYVMTPPYKLARTFYICL